jgi:hypothetical protein
MIIIPFGVDCSVASFIKKFNLRTLAFPFDWTVTYDGISECIKDNFSEFIPSYGSRINKYDVYFHHDFTPETFSNDEIKYNRRTSRLLDILEKSTELIAFFRRGHCYHHHGEYIHYCGKYNNITNDIEEGEKLDKCLTNKYPNLHFKIFIILQCPKCFDEDKTYNSSSNKVQVYNIVKNNIETQENNNRFEMCMSDILLNKTGLEHKSL